LHAFIKPVKGVEKIHLCEGIAKTRRVDGRETICKLGGELDVTHPGVGQRCDIAGEQGLKGQWN
jgi:hypothetical protein